MFRFKGVNEPGSERYDANKRLYDSQSGYDTAFEAQQAGEVARE